ncbi:MAG: hypothetical protein ACRDQC_03910 [Gaiellales bacterium]
MVGIVASACSLGGAGASSSRRSHIVPATLLSHFRGSGIQFDYPASWSHHRHGFSTSMTGPIIDLSTQPMINPCTTTGNTTQCTLPVRRLKPGGVVVVWDTGGGFSIQSRRPDLGVRVRVIRPGCPKVGGDEAVVGSIVASHRRVFLVSACLRGPNVAANERAVRAMLASAVPVD